MARTNTNTGGGGGVGTVTSVSGANSIVSTPNPITNAGFVQLVGDVLAPGNNYYYGTDGSGTKGFFTLPAGGVTSVSDDGGGVVTVDNSNPSTPIVGFGGVNVRVPSLLYGDGKSGTPLSTYISKDTVNDNYFTGLTGPTAPGAYNMLFDAYTTTIWNGITGSKNVMLGYNLPPAVTGDSNIIIGDTAGAGTSSEQNIIAIGKNTTALNTGSIALGKNAATTKTYQFVVGGNTGSGAEIPNWKINGVEYVMPSTYGSGTNLVLTDVANNGTLTWEDASTLPVGTPSMQTANYGTTVDYSAGAPANNTNLSFDDNSTPGATTVLLPDGVGTIGDVITINDLLGVSSTSNIIIDAGGGNTITWSGGVTQTALMSVDASSYTFRKISSTQWMLEN